MPDWQAILDREGPVVWRTVYRILGHHADAEECFQETFVAALAVSRRAPVQCWRALLQRLAAARAIDRLRQRQRRGGREKTTDWETVCGPSSPPSQAAEEAELSDRLRAALSQLPPQQAEVFCLHCLEGWSYQEIAERLDLSIDAVGVSLHRARQRLRELLAALAP